MIFCQSNASDYIKYWLRHPAFEKEKDLKERAEYIDRIYISDQRVEKALRDFKANILPKKRKVNITITTTFILAKAIKNNLQYDITTL